MITPAIFYACGVSALLLAAWLAVRMIVEWWRGNDDLMMRHCRTGWIFVLVAAFFGGLWKTFP